MKISRLLPSTVIAGLAITLPATAEADLLEACGGAYFEALAEGDCELVPLQECETQCEPVATETVCAARLYTDCESECSLERTTECTTTCTEACTTDCETSEEPSCFGLGMADCQQACNAKCDGAENVGECRSSCAHTCAANCDSQCGGLEDNTECTTVCDSACVGSCVAKANLDCQVECQANSYPVCKEEVVTECNEECEQTGAAIFCDGQFLASGGDLQACADELAAQFSFSFDVDVDADVDVDVDPDEEDEGDTLDLDDDGEDELSCAVGRSDSPFMASLLFLVGLGAARLRSRRPH